VEKQQDKKDLERLGHGICAQGISKKEKDATYAEIDAIVTRIFKLTPTEERLMRELPST